jgi:hypothetical protein
VSFAAITLYVASERVFIVVSVYFIMDSVRKLLDTPWYCVTVQTVLVSNDAQCTSSLGIDVSERNINGIS